MNPPALRRLTTTAWLSGAALVPPAIVALLDGLSHGLALRSMMPDVLAMALTVAAPVWPLSVLAGYIILRRGRPGLAPADAEYTTAARLAGTLLMASVVLCIGEVATLALWPAKFNPAWFGTTAGGFVGFAGLGLIIGAGARWRERRMALGLWADPRALVSLFTNAGSDHPPAALYYGGRAGAPGVR